MPHPHSAQDILDREFLDIRAEIVRLAASLDRIDRAEGSVERDSRMNQIHSALDWLCQRRADRAEQVQMVFSLPYNANWQEELQIR